MEVRAIRQEDIEKVLDIYKPYVLDTTITFEYEVPTLEEFTARVSEVTSKYPWLVCVDDGVIVGFAYAAEYCSRIAYGWDCELSIYINRSKKREGIGRLLYQGLFRILKELGYVNAYAVITVPSECSEQFHKKFGFIEEGRSMKAGYKFGSWLDVAWQVKRLMPFEEKPDELPRPWKGEVYE